MLFRDHTAFVPPPTPEVVDGEKPAKYKYTGFPNVLNTELFPPKDPPPQLNLVHLPLGKKTFIAKRSKTEIKNSLKVR